jgi:hypothetical protein
MRRIHAATSDTFIDRALIDPADTKDDVAAPRARAHGARATPTR